MKTKNVIIAIVLFLVGSFSACCNEEGQRNKHDIISSNLLRNGSVDTNLLVGEWNIAWFAYTTDGKKISNRTEIPIDPTLDIEWIASQNGISITEAVEMVRPRLTIPFKEQNDVVCEGLWTVSVCNTSCWDYSINNNLINLELFGSTLKNCPYPAEDEVFRALSNAHSFVVRNDELIIYFTGVENRNLLIFKGREL